MSPTLIEFNLTQGLVILVGVIGVIVILLNIVAISKLNSGNFKRLATMTLSLILFFSLAGFLRSIQVFTGIHTYAGIELQYLEYGIYSIVYIIAAFKIYNISKTFGFVE